MAQEERIHRRASRDRSAGTHNYEQEQNVRQQRRREGATLRTRATVALLFLCSMRSVQAAYARRWGRLQPSAAFLSHVSGRAPDSCERHHAPWHRGHFHEQPKVSPSLFPTNRPGLSAPLSTQSKAQMQALSQSQSGSEPQLEPKPFHGEVSPFSHWANHVQVSEEDLPLTVVDVINRACAEHVSYEYDGTNSTSDRGNVDGKDDTSNMIEMPKSGTAKLTARQLLHLGSIWYLPATEFDDIKIVKESIRAGQKIYKPQRLSLQHADMSVQLHDYFRVHHVPRRFTAVYEYDWHASSNDVIVSSSDPHFMVINKPPLVPVHQTVDNQLENVLGQLNAAQPHDYLVTTQRLDINTSGFLVVATNKTFAAYFAQLLRRKTKRVLRSNSMNEDDDGGAVTAVFDTHKDPIIKTYKCLVICPSSLPDTKNHHVDAHQNLQQCAQNRTIIQHWLQKGVRAPRNFSATRPDDYDSGDWSECLLQITNVSKTIPLTSQIRSELWPKDPSTMVPKDVCGVIELKIQLLTGRTHQIRGQLACMGYPIVGDEQYGGALPSTGFDSTLKEQRLALQCCHLEFVDPDYRDGDGKAIQSERRNSYDLQEAWWSSIIPKEDITTYERDLLADIQQRATPEQEAQEDGQQARPDLLPPRVQLSPGKNKYVIVKVIPSPAASAGPSCDSGNISDDTSDTSTSNDPIWFVKSASPKECGGPYHANVADDLVEWIVAAGYDNVKVVGGGRIDYKLTATAATATAADKQGHATVYGKSIGFGRGDHYQVAALIESWSDGTISATVDASPSLY